jgi:Domain of unknown function (DUF6471)
MKTDAEWRDQAKGIIRGELKRRNLTYEQLAERLAAIGVHDTARNIANKVSRGSFTAVFMLQCLEAIGAKTITLSAEWLIPLTPAQRHAVVAWDEGRGEDG